MREHPSIAGDAAPPPAPRRERGARSGHPQVSRDGSGEPVPQRRGARAGPRPFRPRDLAPSRREHHAPYLERFQQSPRGAILIHPSKQSTLRASISSAFRKPTFLESYLALPIQLPVTGAAQISEGVRREDKAFILNAERIVSAELGYLNQESDYFVVDTSFFYNRVSSLIRAVAFNNNF
ncbi:TonB-dependent receptor [Salmonella enterica subsp. enterica serovar Dessau]|uniref:TonB-dependent receptor n=1 Tax=Salmonella enterica subsp. enterica serovar Dessau TaxID=2564349 RepID=A0A8E5IMP9_SALET|nr:TonB-dependent receptor [Salmonella enterica subsp. enterica serovar Dessau]